MLPCTTRSRPWQERCIALCRLWFLSSCVCVSDPNTWGTCLVTDWRCLRRSSAIHHAGYQVSISHANKDALKTNCPPAVLWDLLRGWVCDCASSLAEASDVHVRACKVKLHPVTQKNIKPNSPAAKILAIQPTCVRPSLW